MRVEARLLGAGDRDRPARNGRSVSRTPRSRVLSVELAAEPLELGDVDGVDVGDVRDLGPRRRQPLGDPAAHASHRLGPDLVATAAWSTSVRTAAAGDDAVEVGVDDPPTGPGAAHVGQVRARATAPVPAPPAPQSVERPCRRRQARLRMRRRLARRRVGVAQPLPARRARRWRRLAAGRRRGRRVRRLRSPSPVSISTRSLPTASTSPGSPWSAVTTPVTGDETSTVALSVSTSASTEFGCDLVADGHEPRHELGLGDALADVGELHPERRSCRQQFPHRPPDAVGPGKVGPLEGVRVRRVPSAHPHDRCFEVDRSSAPGRCC